MVLRDRMLSPVSMVTEDKLLRRQSGSTDETFRNTVEPFYSACSPCTVQVVQQRASRWKAGSDSADEVSLTHSFHVEAIPLQLGCQLTERSNMTCSSGGLH